MRLLIVALLLSSMPVAAQTGANAKPDADKERLICKREVPIGSLIASRKVCLTKTQWEQRAADGNSDARRLVAEGTGRGQGQ